MSENLHQMRLAPEITRSRGLSFTNKFQDSAKLRSKRKEKILCMQLDGIIKEK